MAIIVDQYIDYIGAGSPHGYRYWCHCMTTSHTQEGLNELHAFAEKLGLKRKYFQRKNPRQPHYDLGTNQKDSPKSKRALAILRGAEEVDWRGLVDLGLWTPEEVACLEKSS